MTSRPSVASFGAPLPGLVEELLAEQRSLTAVERFAALHDGGSAEGLYRDLLPLREPGPGEQYAFEVDLDRCTGCKACVTACHALNGLDDEETWRSVGLLQKVRGAATRGKVAQQHVTTACHHCLEPGCAQGCPTLAYEKDPATGVVRHLDDQCFGCQYCVLKCPYDVPQYNAARGIVRKCDLCVDRLRAGEAPACAQACPTGAIRVTVVAAADVRRAPEAAFDLPGAPDPSRVMPTTRYLTTRDATKNFAPVDAMQVWPEHAHLPLVFMLVASQAAIGYWILLALASLPSPDSRLPTSAPFPLPELLGILGVQGALGLSLLHLGRPRLAWKAFLGWRRSWLSREVIAFVALAGTTGLAAAIPILEWAWGVSLPALLRRGASLAVIASAVAAIHASAMVYRDTPRALWATRATLWRFALAAAILGIPSWLLVPGSSRGVLLALPVAQFLKLLLESSLLRRGDDADFGPLWKGAQLLRGPLRKLHEARVGLGLAGGILLPLALAAGILTGPVSAWLLSILVLTGAGELLERYLFFATAIAPRMPGSRR